mgnify:CR=1 FL=1
MLPYLTIISFFIGIGIIIYQVGRWRQKTETDKEEIKKKLNIISEKIEKIPEDFWSKFIDAYEMLEKTKEKPRTTKKKRSER